MFWARLRRGVCPSASPRIVACGALLVFAATAQAGVISLTGQNRFVDVTTVGTPGPLLQPQDRRADAADFGPFQQSVELSILPGIDQIVNQNSTLTLTSDGMGATLDGHGRLFHSVSQNGLNGTSHFQVDFNLTAPEPYSLTYNGQQGDPRDSHSEMFVPGRFTGPSAPGSLEGDIHTTNFFTILTYAGTLQPGSYELLAESHTIGFASFDVTLEIGSTAIPLPSALQEALAALPVLVLIMWYMRAISCREANQ